MAFEIVFITEGPACSPAAEIQYGGQRLCVLRPGRTGYDLDFGLETYVGRPPVSAVPLTAFLETVRAAEQELTAWCHNLARGQHEA